MSKPNGQCREKIWLSAQGSERCAPRCKFSKMRETMLASTSGSTPCVPSRGAGSIEIGAKDARSSCRMRRPEHSGAPSLVHVVAIRVSAGCCHQSCTSCAPCQPLEQRIIWVEPPGWRHGMRASTSPISGHSRGMMCLPRIKASLFNSCVKFMSVDTCTQLQQCGGTR